MTFILWIGLVTGRLLWPGLSLLWLLYPGRRKALPPTEPRTVKRLFLLSIVVWGMVCLVLNPYRDWRKAEMIANLLKASHPTESYLNAYLTHCRDDDRMRITQWREFWGDQETLLQFYRERHQEIEVLKAYPADTAVTFAIVPEGPFWVSSIPWTLSHFLPPEPVPSEIDLLPGTQHIHYFVSLTETTPTIWDLRCGL